MKKIIFSLVSMILLQCSVSGQQLLSTKSAQVKFNATGGIEKIAATNNEADCKFLPNTGQIVFSILIKGFRFENQLMEDHFNENYLESTKFPKSDFKGYIKTAKPIDYKVDGNYEVTADGILTIHGVSQKINTAGKINITGGKVTLLSEFKVKLKDYQIAGLYIGDKIAAEATINITSKF